MKEQNEERIKVVGITMTLSKAEEFCLFVKSLRENFEEKIPQSLREKGIMRLHNHTDNNVAEIVAINKVNPSSRQDILIMSDPDDIYVNVKVKLFLVKRIILTKEKSQGTPERIIYRMGQKTVLEKIMNFGLVKEMPEESTYEIVNRISE